MQLIGMLDSPYVRRVAISLQLLQLPFKHRSLSVFRTFDEFRQINPVVKAPSLICDDGTVLMDSNLILEYAERLATKHSLMPVKLPELQHALRITGLALAACEKSVQIVYEGLTRPPDKRHTPWVERVTTQMIGGFKALENELGRSPLAFDRSAITQAGVTTAVVWQFAQAMVAELVPSGDYPQLAAYSAKVEQLPEFAAAPHGDSTYQARG